MEREEQLAEALEAAKAAHFDAATGACDFAALVISREHGHLAACLASIAEVDPRRLRIAVQTAFWLNFYNACVLRRSEEHTSELQSRVDLVCRLLLEKKKKTI